MYKIENTRNIDHTVEFNIPQISISVTYDAPRNTGYCITNSYDTYKLLLQTWNYHTVNWIESCYVICLDRRNSVTGIFLLAIGGPSICIIDVKALLMLLINTNSSGLIISHNHPTGNLKPSNSDIAITAKIKNVVEMLDISLLDHVIFTENGYYSFADQGML